MYLQVGELESRLETSGECTRALESQNASRNLNRAAKAAYVDGLEGHVRMSEEEAGPMSTTIPEHGSQMCAAEAARSCAKVALQTAEYQFKDKCVFGTSLEEMGGQLQSDKTRLDG